jgi:hypothetical protein
MVVKRFHLPEITLASITVLLPASLFSEVRTEQIEAMMECTTCTIGGPAITLLEAGFLASSIALLFMIGYVAHYAYHKDGFGRWG